MERPGILIPCFLRLASLKLIIEKSIQNGVKKFYFSIDRSPDKDEQINQMKIIEFMKSMRDFEVHIRMSKRNIGCALNVTCGIDWALHNEKEIIVLEDDCIPSTSFFEFIEQSKDTFNSSQRILSICGSQFLEFSENLILESHYPFFWGWYTSSTKWNVLKKFLVEPTLQKTSISKISTSENSYWKAGHRRAMFRFVDVWDTIVSANMVFQDYRSLVPSKNLIQNIGDDQFATNVSSSKLTRKIVHETSGSWLPVGYIDSYESCVRDRIYGIAKLHLISNKLRRFSDFISHRNNKSNFSKMFLNSLNSNNWLYF